MSGDRERRRRRSRHGWLGVSPGPIAPSPTPTRRRPRKCGSEGGGARWGRRGVEAARSDATEAGAVAAPRSASSEGLTVLTIKTAGPCPRHQKPKGWRRHTSRGRRPRSRSPPRARRGSEDPAATIISNTPSLPGGCLRWRRGEIEEGGGAAAGLGFAPRVARAGDAREGREGSPPPDSEEIRFHDDLD